ncbi:glycerol uptake facilitator protein-like 6 isoform X2 [Cimex lectularius]|uniref:Aquaporin n=1 Tax=Cimex lectularius TaxID=79782 RepID=A0A8I6SLM1_CIMLE|nr:glycerol uptake facilitator protein-like 6 isoform X2 [Cimex lectularius]
MQNILNCQYSGKPKGGKNDSTVTQNICNGIKVFLAEFLGTFIFMFLGCGCLNSHSIVNWNEFTGSYSFGVTFAAAVQVSYNTSYGHLNPVVTLIFFMYGYISIKLVIVYVIAQLLGAIVGTALYKFLSEQNFHILTIGKDPYSCETRIHPKLGSGLAFMWEFLGSILLGLFISSFLDPRSPKNRENYSMKMALLIGVLNTVLTPYTGGSLNPARSFAPAFINNHWLDQWIDNNIAHGNRRVENNIKSY